MPDRPYASSSCGTCDAILMGAANVRYDNPRLLVRSKIRRDEDGSWVPSPIEVTVAERVELARCADYFTTSETETLVYSASPRVRDALSQLGPLRR